MIHFYNHLIITQPVLLCFLFSLITHIILMELLNLLFVFLIIFFIPYFRTLNFQTRVTNFHFSCFLILYSPTFVNPLPLIFLLFLFFYLYSISIHLSSISLEPRSQMLLSNLQLI